MFLSDIFVGVHFFFVWGGKGGGGGGGEKDYCVAFFPLLTSFLDGWLHLVV